jgi:hypothetical protein
MTTNATFVWPASTPSNAFGARIWNWKLDLKSGDQVIVQRGPGNYFFGEYIGYHIDPLTSKLHLLMEPVAYYFRDKKRGLRANRESFPHSPNMNVWKWSIAAMQAPVVQPVTPPAPPASKPIPRTGGWSTKHVGGGVFVAQPPSPVLNNQPPVPPASHPLSGNHPPPPAPIPNTNPRPVGTPGGTKAQFNNQVKSKSPPAPAPPPSAKSKLEQLFGNNPRLASRRQARKMYAAQRDILSKARDELELHLETLGLTKTVTLAEFKAKRREVMSRCHPDKEAAFVAEGKGNAAAFQAMSTSALTALNKVWDYITRRDRVPNTAP